MKFKRVLAILTSAALVASVFVGCQKKDTTQNSPATTQSTSSGPVKITYYGGWTGPDMDKMKALVDKYNSEQSKVQVEFTSLQWTQMFAKFLTDLKAGSPPDVIAAHTFELGQFADMGVLDSKAIDGLKLNKSDYLDVAWNGSSYKGKQYAVPIDVNMHALYYNQDLFAKAGITAAPKTGDELISIGQKLTVDKNGKHPNEAGFDASNVAQYGLGFSMNHHIFYQFYGLMNQESSNPFTDTMTKVDIDEQKASKAIGFLQDLVLKYKIVPKGEKSPIDDFKAGTVAMLIDGNWQMAGLDTSTMKWATAPYPKVFDKQGVWGAAEVLAFPLNDKGDANKKAAAADFVKWLSNNSADWAKSGQLPANKTALEVAKKMPGRDAFVQELDYTNFLPAHPLATQIFSSVAPSPILTAAQDAVLNGKNPTDIVKQLKKDMEAVLANK